MSDWLDRSASDLEMVRRAMFDPPDTAQAAYHLQQSAEKAVKAFLAHLGIRYPRAGGAGHDIRIAAALIPAGHPLRDDAGALADLTPWVTAFRYPADDPLLATEPPAPREIETWRLKVEAFVERVGVEVRRSSD